MGTLNESTQSRRAKRPNTSAAGLINEGKKFVGEGKKAAKELYKEGLDKVNDAGESVKEYSDGLLKKVQKRPLASMMIAGGVGFLLSLILKK